MMNLGDLKIGALLTAVIAVGAVGTYFGIQEIDSGDVMVSKSGAQLLGHVTATVYDEDGYIKAYRQSDNAIVENGFTILAEQLFNGMNLTTTGPVNAIGIGTGAAAPTSTDTTLTYVAACTNQTTSWTSVGATTFGANAAIGINGTATFGPSAGCADTYQEAGAFDSVAAGGVSDLMFARNTYASVTLTAADSLQINWNFQFDDT